MHVTASPTFITSLTARSLVAAVAIGSATVCAPASFGPTAVPASASSAVSLLATQAAIMMNGTFTPDVTPEFAAAVMDNYIKPLAGSGYTAVPLRTPESLWPFSGLGSLTYNESTKVGYQLLDAKYREIVGKNSADGAPNTPMLVFGYSQSAFISSVFGQTLSEEMKKGGQVPPTTFFLVGNTNVPNGGLMSRFNGLGLTPWTPLVFAPTDTGSLTYDVFRQYDPFADFPAYPLNALAVINSLMGYLLHFTLPVSGNPPWLNPVISVLNKLITPISLNPASPNYVKPIVSQYQDTIYQFVPTAKLPILDPLRLLGMSKLADALDPVLRPLIEAGYDRSTSFGVPTPAKFGLPNMDAAFKQSWQALLHMLDPARNPARAVAAAVKPAAVTAGTAGGADTAAAGVPTQSVHLAEPASVGAGTPGPDAAPVTVAQDPPAPSGLTTVAADENRRHVDVPEQARVATPSPDVATADPGPDGPPIGPTRERPARRSAVGARDTGPGPADQDSTPGPRQTRR